ncbi:MAG: cell wall-binding repeat-containing protein [Tissierellia bacterium]|nr:cell wall-binding repeat-containing protein [Tissierellia bacterium]
MKISIKKAVASALVVGSILSAIPSNIAMAEEEIKAVSINGESLVETSNAVSDYLFDEVENLYLVSAENYVDALTGGVTIGENNGTIIYLRSEGLDEQGEARIKGAKNLYIIGGEGSVPKEFESRENFRGRISGKNRYETAIEIAKTLKNRKGTIIANAHDYPDALSSTALALNQKYNIVLVAKDSVPASVKEYLKDAEGEILFVGGDNSLSPEVKKEVYTIAGKDLNTIEENTIAGKNRYETSVKIAEKFDDAKNVIVVDGNDPYDALLGSTLSANKQAPILLTRNDASEDLVAMVQGVKGGAVYGVSTNGLVNASFLKEVVAKATGKGVDDVNILDQHGNEVQEVQAEKVEEVKEVPFTGWVSAGLNVRSGIGTTNKIIGTMAKGTKVSGNIVDGWLKFDYNGQTGYSSMKYISDTEVKPDPKPQAPAKNNNNGGGSNKEFSYSRVLTMNATAYTSDPAENGGYSVTALGTPIRVGVAAVDPRVIPLGTKLYVEGYGYCTAEDTGGAIKGNKIDLVFGSKQESYNFGRRQVTVYVLD